MPIRYTKIYLLRVPDGPPRYVGKTIHTLSDRLSRHYRESKCRQHRRANWLNKQLRTGVPVLIELIEEVEGDGADRERYWIKEYKRRGYDLVNATEGGDGVAGMLFTPESRRQMSVSHRRVMANPERRAISRETARRVWDSKSPEERAAWSDKLLKARLNKHLKKVKVKVSVSHDIRSAVSRAFAHKFHSMRSPEERRATAMKSAATRARNKEERQRAGIEERPIRYDPARRSSSAKNQWARYTQEQKQIIREKISIGRRRFYQTKKGEAINEQ